MQYDFEIVISIYLSNSENGEFEEDKSFMVKTEK